MKRQLEQIMSLIGDMSNALVYSQEELEALLKHGRIRYNLDFAYLYPLLFSRKDKWQSDKQRDTAILFRSLMTESHSMICLYLSGPSLMEFLEGLMHMEKRIQRRYKMAPESSFYTGAFAQNTWTSKSTVTSSEILKTLRDIKRGLHLDSLLPPIEHLESLIETGAIEGLADEALSFSLEENVKDVEHFISVFAATRINSSPFSHCHDRFHDIVDVANILISRRAHTEPLFFLSPSAKRFRLKLSDCKSSARMRQKAF